MSLSLGVYPVEETVSPRARLTDRVLHLYVCAVYAAVLLERTSSLVRHLHTSLIDPSLQRKLILVEGKAISKA